MVSIYRVYNTLKNLANKEQKGFVTPEVFNSFAHMAQLNVFNEIMNEQIEAKKLAKAGVDTGTVSSMKEKKIEDMSYYYTKVKDSSNTSSVTKPDNLYKIIYVTFQDTNTNTSQLDNDYGKCELVYNPHLFEEIKESRLSYFTDNYKVALVGSSKIEVYPADNSEEYWLHYYSTPGSYQIAPNSSTFNRVVLPPVYTPLVIGGMEMFNEQQSRNFDLPASYESEVISEIAGMIGLNLRDQDIQQYSAAKTSVE
jgi:hypothetical protein